MQEILDVIEEYTSPSEYPILFCGEMVRAILEDRKSQTRRLMKRLRIHPEYGKPIWDEAWLDNSHDPIPCLKVPYRGNEMMGETVHRHFPKWMPGDLLWVKETFCRESNFNLGDILDYSPPFKDGRPINRVENPEHGEYWEQPHYRATDPSPELEIGEEDPGVKWIPSIFMPRWASRITLRVEQVRIERIQDISEEDARAEGINETSLWMPPDKDGEQYAAMYDERYPLSSRKAAFAWLWDSLHAKPKPAMTNPFTSRREMCRVAYPWNSGTSSKLIDAAMATKWFGCNEYIIGNPYVFATTFSIKEVRCA